MTASQSVKNIAAVELCPVVGTIRALGSEAKLIVIRYLSMKGMGFNDLLRATSLNSKTLSKTLKSLETDGIVVREVISTRPFKVRYTLAPRGQDLGPMLDAMGSWGKKWLEAMAGQEIIGR